MRRRFTFFRFSLLGIVVGLATAALMACGQTTALAADTELGRLAANIKPGEVKELATKNCNHDLFKMCRFQAALSPAVDRCPGGFGERQDQGFSLLNSIAC